MCFVLSDIFWEIFLFNYIIYITYKIIMKNCIRIPALCRYLQYRYLLYTEFLKPDPYLDSASTHLESIQTCRYSFFMSIRFLQIFLCLFFLTWKKGKIYLQIWKGSSFCTSETDLYLTLEQYIELLPVLLKHWCSPVPYFCL